MNKVRPIMVVIIHFYVHFVVVIRDVTTIDNLHKETNQL